jgi:hypothetical protein
MNVALTVLVVWGTSGSPALARDRIATHRDSSAPRRFAPEGFLTGRLYARGQSLPPADGCGSHRASRASCVRRRRGDIAQLPLDRVRPDEGQVPFFL